MGLYVPLLLLVIATAFAYGLIGGDSATIGQFPYIASLQGAPCHPSGSILVKCAGTIISPNYILTAAHCVNKQDHSQDAILKIVTGIIDLEGGDTTYKQEVGIANITINPNYLPTYDTVNMNMPDDIAIVKLNATLKFDKGTSAIKLPAEGAELDNGTNVIFAGWKMQGCWLDKRDPALYFTNKYTTISFKECYDKMLALLYNEENAVTIDKDVSMCTGPFTSGSNYNELVDAGSPIVKDGVAYGIHSWIFNYQKVINVFNSTALPGPSGVYVKLSKYIKWIKENVDDL